MYSFFPSDYLAIRTAPEILQLTFDSEDSVNYYRNLERRVARFFNAESVLFFPDGYLALVALLRNLIQEDDWLFLPPAMDGMIPDALEILQRLFKNLQIRTITDDCFQQIPTSVSRVVVLANSICESSCSIVPLNEWDIQLKQLWKNARIPSLLILDDSLGVGLLGPHARGTFEHFGLTANKIPDSSVGVQYFFSASLAEAFGSSGGFLVGSRKWLKTVRRTEPCCCTKNEFPLSNVVAAEKAVELAEDSQRRKRLRQNIQILKEKLQKYGISYESNPLLPFVLVKVASPKEILKGMTLRGCRLGITHFTKKPKLCIAVNADHTEKEIDYLAQSLEVVIRSKDVQEIDS